MSEQATETVLPTTPAAESAPSASIIQESDLGTELVGLDLDRMLGKAPAEATKTAADDSEVDTEEAEPAETTPEAAEAAPAPAKVPEKTAEDTAASGNQEENKQQLDGNQAAIAARVQKFTQQFQELRQKVAEGKYDAFDDGKAAAETMLEGLSLLAAQVQEINNKSQSFIQEQAKQQSLQRFESTYADLGKGKGLEIWQAELKAAQAKYPSKEAAVAVATELFNQRVAAIRAQAKGKAAPAPAAAKPKLPGGTIAPVATQPKQSSKPRTIDEKLAAGAYGNLAAIID